MSDDTIDLHLVVMKRVHPFDGLVSPVLAQRIADRLYEAPVPAGRGPTRMLRAAGFVFAALVRDPRSASKCLNVRAYGKRASRLHLLRLAWTLRSLPSFDAIHGQFLEFACDLAVCRRIGVTGTARLLCSVRGADATARGEVSNTELGIAAAESVTLLPVSGSLRDLIVRRGYMEELVTVVPSGVPLEEYRFVPPARRQPRRHGHSNDLELIVVGRLVPKKGVRLAIEAVAALREIGIPAVLTVIGDGPERKVLESYCAEADLGAQVVFRGALSASEVRSQMMQADLSLVPSLTGSEGNIEGIPNVAKEAMACGTIVVASDHSGLPELIADGSTGFLFPEGDAGALIAAIRRALDHRECWDEIAHNARRFIEEHHSIDAMVSRLMTLYC